MIGAERAITFSCGGETLVGVISVPAASMPLERVGVVVVVGGPQYRIGSHRQFVRLARRLAGEGHAVLRFDYRGMGDSEGAARDFEDTADDVAAAIDALMVEVPGLVGVALWGLCDGASASLLHLHRHKDRRVRGLCLVNPWVRSEASLARTHMKHYYGRRLLQPEFWRKLLRGGVAKTAWTGLLANLRLARAAAPSGPDRSARYQDRMADAGAAFEGPVLLLLSGDDYTAKEFVEFAAAHDTWSRVLRRPTLKRVDLPGADHTFATARDQRVVEDATLDWLGTLECSRLPAAVPQALPRAAAAIHP